MKKRIPDIIAWVAIVALVLVQIGIFVVASRPDDYHSRSGVVVMVDRGDDIVTFEDSVGYQWDFFGAEDWQVGDHLSCVMKGNRTQTILDDEIVSVHYER